jgi:hypothetical protein
MRTRSPVLTARSKAWHKAVPAELWEIEDAAERAVPKVEFKRG